MSTYRETKVPLAAFHRHFLVTHLKGNSDCVLKRLEARALKSGESFERLMADLMASCYPQAGFRDDNWYAAEILLDCCYFAHEDFRLFPVPKDGRFVDFLPAQREKIQAGCFPCALQICEPWSHSPPEPLVQERGGKYYVLDGQLRVIRYWYHSVSNVKVFIYRGKQAL